MLRLFFLLVLLTGCAPAPPSIEALLEARPERLSAWQLMESDGQHLRLADRQVPYQLNATLFSDYAHKLRTVALPEGVSAAINPDGSLDFPVGTILSKTFYYPRDKGGLLMTADSSAALDDQGRLDLGGARLIETRLLVHGSSGWVGLPYVWNEAQTDAVLEVTGAIKPLQLTSDAGQAAFAYVVPDQNQCAGCHVSNMQTGDLQPLGPRLANLNRPRNLLTPVQDQLGDWRQRGMLAGDAQLAGLPATAAWEDHRQPLVKRARAYLDINCGHCHNPLGPADTSGLFLDLATTDPVRLGECKLPIAAGQGTGGHRFGLVPGAPEESILVFRMLTSDPGAMMPELGRSLVHTEGVQLVSDWIKQLPGQCG